MDRAAGESHKREWKLDAQGYHKEGPPRDEMSADVGSTTHAREIKVQQALTIRVLAMDVACLMSFEAAHLITQFLMKKMMSPPPDSRYAPPTLEQIRKADVHIWRCLGKLCRRGIRRVTGGGGRRWTTRFAWCWRILILPLSCHAC